MEENRYLASVGSMFISDISGTEAYSPGNRGNFHIVIEEVDLTIDSDEAADIHLRDFVLLRKMLGDVRFYRKQSLVCALSEADVEQLLGGDANDRP